MLNNFILHQGSEFTSLSSSLNELIQIGIALSSEKNINTLLEKIAAAAGRVSGAEGVTVYTCSGDKQFLDFAVVRNKALNLDAEVGNGLNLWPRINLYHEDGSRNYSNASAYCALSGKAINITDVYNEKGFDFSGTKRFDKLSNYRSRSMLLIPMCDHEDEVIGVLQLLNRKLPGQREVVPFPRQLIEIISGLASQAAIAITNVRLIEQTEQLMKSFVKAIAYAIDEKSPYTAGHIARVVLLTEKICNAVSESKRPEFFGIHFTEDELEEIRLAAWMHDIGKIATPQFIIDKATKLETVVDRIELVQLRLEILKRDFDINNRHQGGDTVSGEIESDSDRLPADTLESIDNFLFEINKGREYLNDESIQRIMEIADWPVNIKGKKIPLLSKDELECCIIKKGTLTESERAIINRHVIITMEMLTKLPFPRKWQRVPEFAGSHHERLDGSGYPQGLRSKAIPLPARIIAIADIFEALTATDRPYKSGLTLSRAVDILAAMVKDRQLDADLCDLLLEDGVAIAYACENLNEKQLDGYEWRSKKYRCD